MNAVNLPSSANHCAICPFEQASNTGRADEDLEGVLVVNHLNYLVNGDDAAPPPVTRETLSPQRLLAARACAALILDEKCLNFHALYDIQSGAARIVRTGG